jgi:hypothetical protein
MVLHLMQTDSEEETQMKFRLARLSVLLLPIMALVASVAPPAHANVVGVVVVNGTANVGAGLSYPCVGNGVPDLTKCPPPVGNGQPGNIGVTFGGIGVGAVVKVAKPKCPAGSPAGTCVEVGTFAIAATGSVTGHCGLSSGALAGSVTPTLALGTKSNNRTFNVSFTGIGGVLVLTGTTCNGENITGAVLAVPDATTGASCTNTAGKNFLIAGPIVIHRP